MYHFTRLPNGLTVATAEMAHMASVSLGIWVGVGGRCEPAEMNGVCHFIEHILFKGTKKRSALEISQAVEGVGGYLNAFTSEETTCYYCKARHDRFAELFDVLVDMFLNASFARAEIDKERNVIKDEIAMYLDQPQIHVQDLLNETMWPNHPLGRPLSGSEQTLDAMQRTNLLAYMRHNYVAGKTIITAAGHVRHDLVVNAVRRVASRFPGARCPPSLPAPNGQTAPRVRLFTKDSEQTQIAFGIRTCSRHDERRYALRVLNTILGENMSSRLFQVVREEHGLAYSIHSALSYYDDVGALVISAGLDTDNLRRTLSLVLRELRKLAAEPPSRAELRRARDYLIGQFDLHLESTENQMNWLGERLLGYGCISPPDEVKQKLAAVKPGQIRAAARDFFRSEQMSLAMVSPLKNDKGLATLLS